MDSARKSVVIELKRILMRTDLLIIGGGTAGCYAAVTAARQSPERSVLLVEKADIRRSGCLAAGVNALNAYLPAGRTPTDYLEFVRKDAEDIVRDDLVVSMADGFNDAAADLEKMGLVIQKDERGAYAVRGRWNIRINGENIKPILAAEVRRYPNILVLNHVNVTEYLTAEGYICGAAGFSVRQNTAYVFSARAVICTTGGAAGLYRPNHPGFSRHKLWYPPFNTGAGFAMGIRAGAEMTSFEMRFVALRCKDTIAPTGTLALGAGAKQVNALGEVYESRYGLTTSQRVYGTTEENRAGRGPCSLQTEGISKEKEEELYKAYLNMAPAQTLKWLDGGETPSVRNVEIAGTEPYIAGGHTGSGYWVDSGRRTTLRGLYAAGDVSGGAPAKFVTGALAEGAIAARTALTDMEDVVQENCAANAANAAQPILAEYERFLSSGGSRQDVFQMETDMQKIMDTFAGGLGQDYRYSTEGLSAAGRRIAELSRQAATLRAADSRELLRVYELLDRLTVCETLLAHMAARRETRWPGFGVYTNFPEEREDYRFFVNSRRENGKIRILYRELAGNHRQTVPTENTGGEAGHEHSD